MPAVSGRPPPNDEGDRRARALPSAFGRYRVRRLLGRGGTGVVYEAHDTRDDAIVALKTIGHDQPEIGEHLYRLKHEFRALADLQHPNLVRFGELSCEEGQWFFTMELVRGTDFVAYVRPGDTPAPSVSHATTRVDLAPSAVSGVAPVAARAPRSPLPPLDVERLRGALPQLVAALSAVHAAGHVHRDVKPSNVLVTGDGRVVVLDFGLATALADRPGASDGIVGTPAFMAPEQVEEGAVSPATDWYAVGVMLFAALTGGLPFDGGATEILVAKISREAPKVRDLAPDAPEDLAALCDDLLRLTPDRRPELSDLRARLGMRDDSARFVAAEPAAAFVGREAELRALDAAFRDVASGRSRAVVLEGEPGIGKSSLAQRFLASLGQRALTFAGRCYEQESVPFKGIDAIVDALSEHLLERDDVALVLRGGVRYLATVFPALTRVDYVAQFNTRRIDDPSILRERAFGELEGIFAELARTSTVVLYLDDLQWADKDSLALLRRLAGAQAAPLLLVATMRSGAELLADAAALLAAAERIELRGLSASESRVLCGEVGRSEGVARPGDREELIREAAGHPLFLRELLRSSRKSERGPETTQLEAVLWSRIRERDPLEQRFLDMVALAGAPTPYRALARAAEVDVGECQSRLGGLRAAQLVRITRRGEERLVEPYHDRIRESILHYRASGRDAGDAARALAADHLRLGRALLAETPTDALGARVFAIVQHLNAGRSLIEARAERLRVAALNLAACREAHLATAYDRAREHACVGLELAGEMGWTDAYPTTRDLWVERMRAEHLAGDAAAAERSFAAACARVTATAERTSLHVTWLELESNGGRFAQAIAVGRARLRELGIDPPARITTVTLLARYLATRRAQSGRPIESLASLETSRDMERDSAMRVLMAMAPAAFWVDTNLVGWISLELARLSMRHGVSEASSFGFAGYGVVLAGAFGKYAEAAAFGRLALALNERFGSAALDARLLQINGEFLAGWVRPFAEAKALLQRSYDRALAEGETAYEAFAACCLSHVSILESSDLAQCQATSEWAREVCVRRRDRNMAGSVEAHARYAATLRGSRRAADVGVEVDAEFRALAGEPAKAPGAYYAFYSCNAWLAYLFGEVSSAQALLVDARRLAQANFGNPGTIDFCLLEALVAARAWDTAPWWKRPALRHAVARHVSKLEAWAQGCPKNFEPHALLARAELARLEGDADRAEQTYATAAASARAHGAGLREAMALELASSLADTRGKSADAAQLRAAAAAAYDRCGATAKA